MSGNVPFRVRWELFSPVIVPTMPIHLDALLSWARVREAEFAGVSDVLALQHDLPLERHETAEGWCFKASVLEFEYEGNPLQLHYNRQSDIDAVAEPYMRGALKTRSGVPGFDPLRGMYKAGSVLLTQRFARQVVAYGVGDVARVRVLLSYVDSIGKLRRRAKGAVRSMSIEVSDDDLKWATRNLPLGSEFAGARHALAQQRLHAPYWSKEQQNVMAPVDF